MFFSFAKANKTNGCIYLTSTDLCKNSATGMEPEKSFAESASFGEHDGKYCTDLEYHHVSCLSWVW